MFCFLVLYLISQIANSCHCQSRVAGGNSSCTQSSLLDIETAKKPFLLVAANVSTGGNVKVSQVPDVVGCVQSCCDWAECNIAVKEGSSCYNVHCVDLNECQLVDFRNADTVPVRQIEVLCPNLTKSCNVGTDNCPKNEECVAVGSKRRSGCCHCEEGFSKTTDGTCQKSESTSQLPPTPTTNIPTTTTPYIKHLAISISPTSVQLPELMTNITAIVVPDAAEGEVYHYKWTVIRFPEGQPGTIEVNNEKTLKLSQLSAGDYVFKITVNSTLSFGEALANFTVLPPERVNVPPVAIIRPSSQVIHLPNNVSVFDGSQSTDDSKIVAYNWNMEKGPINYKFEPINLETIMLKDLVEGNYTFKLTVVDSEGDSNSTYSTLEVVKETDYPPEANAGASVVIFLPQNELTLNANQSTDDHGIVSWEWTQLSDASSTGSGRGKPVDMKDTRTPYLHLSNLEEGMYSFQLKVTDAADQSSTAQVDVFVRRRPITGPQVNAGEDKVIALPLNYVLLDGSKTYDDAAINKWQWSQVSGPNDAALSGSSEAKVNATGLTKGQYVFMLIVRDVSGSEGNDTVSVAVVQKENEKPKANAGGDMTVTLPRRSVYLNGSASSDDLAIDSWLWTRESESLAAGMVVGDSDRSNLLMLAKLVPGRYVFRLTVADAQGLVDHDTVTLTVLPNPHELDMVVLTLKSDPRKFTENDLNVVRDQIKLLLHQQGNVNINIGDVVVHPKSGYVVLEFYAAVKVESVWRTVRGTEVVALLRKKLRNDDSVMSYAVLEIDTSVCQNNCSGHGICDQSTRRCLCHAFWMENSIGVAYGSDYNCDWSLLYVVIIASLTLLVFLCAVWSLLHFCRKGALPCKKLCGRKRRRVHRYSPLADPDVMRMSTKISNSLLPSDMESETDSDVMFETKANGQMNGRRPGGVKSDDVKM